MSTVIHVLKYYTNYATTKKNILNIIKWLRKKTIIKRQYHISVFDIYDSYYIIAKDRKCSVLFYFWKAKRHILLSSQNKITEDISVQDNQKIQLA